MEPTKCLTILHTNDFHNKLSIEQAQYIHARKAGSGQNTLLLDAGDAISAGNVGVRLGPEPILELMSESGYDAMTMGNREFHVADSLLRHKIGAAKFPILCANMTYQNEQNAALPAIPFFTKTLENRLKVCIIGVTVPMVTARMTARVVSSFLFTDPVEAVKRIVDAHRQSFDVIVALTHIGLREDRRLSEDCPNLDLIIGGHSHDVLESALLTGPVPILQAGWFGHYLGLAQIEVRDGRVKLLSSKLEALPSPNKVRRS